ncbi:MULTISPECIES: hypothetical protein [Pseudomonas]|uniref:hypothetical protein n=1 Tax=Pseudomonas TaxID=286 RepID=UPI000483F32D|nr:MULTISPECIES: hypothetical protein [Pseudomonas]PRA46586.1 hypothetical protein CQZ98_23235 [Pseudomonas sp. MYb115]QXN52505.1 hypothetical protein KW062_12525 [Pseudomonas fluorescens]WSO26842.1 hypothetical protein VUJ50_12600 [Pseudomonas fluorescens]
MEYTLSDAEQNFGFNLRYPLITRQLGEFYSFERAMDYLRAIVLLDEAALYEPHTFTYEREEAPHSARAIVVMGEFGYLIGTLAQEDDDVVRAVIISEKYAELIDGLGWFTHELSEPFYAILVSGLPLGGLVKMLDYCSTDPECKEVIAEKGFTPEHFPDDWATPLFRYVKALEPGISVAMRKLRGAHIDSLPKPRKYGKAVPRRMSVATDDSE